MREDNRRAERHARAFAAARLTRRARRILQRGRNRAFTGGGRHRARPPESRPQDGIDAALRFAAERSSSALERTAPLVCYPVYAKNPIPRILYSACWENAIAPISVRAAARMPLADLYSTLTSASFSRQSRRLLHLHWTQPVLEGASSQLDAKGRVNEFLDRINVIRDQGTRVVWTIHNVLPHESVYNDEEIVLRSGLAELADRVHVCCLGTLDEVAHLYPVDKQKTVEIPLPSYLGVYPNAVTRPEARLQLGLDPADVVLLCLGNLRPYKGLDFLIEAFRDAARHEPRLRLVVAGEVKGHLELDVERALENHPRVSFFRGAVPDAQLQHFFAAADAFVLPYSRVLNSAALTLAFTFGCPVIAPQLGCVAGAVDPSVGISYLAGDHDAFVSSLASAPLLMTQERRAAVLARAAALSPARVAEGIAEMMKAVLEKET